ncbi:hypothetical protein ACTGJ9_037850 [Bradyrhizobium sp. RDM12]
MQQVDHVTTMKRVAEDLGEDEDWLLRDVANEMEIEDGAIWVDGVGEHGIQALLTRMKNLNRTRPDVRGSP